MHGNCKHGLAYIPEYQTWKRMTQRCTNANRDGFSRYGGRGIKVCERWKCFENFYADMGQRPSPTHSIDRIDNDGDYCKENCRWATDEEQRANRSNTRYLTFNGETLTAKQWAVKAKINYQSFMDRLYNGWSIEKAITTPTRKENRQPC